MSIYHSIVSILLLHYLQVHGVIRRASTFNTGRINHLFDDQYEHKGGGKLIVQSCIVCLFH